MNKGKRKSFIVMTVLILILLFFIVKYQNLGVLGNNNDKGQSSGVTDYMLLYRNIKNPI